MLTDTSRQPTDPTTEADAERDAARAALDWLMANTRCGTLVGDIGPTLESVMRARYGREAAQWRANHDQRKAERDALQAEVAYLRSRNHDAVADARITRAVSLLDRVLQLVDRRGHSWPDAQATVREAESFLVEQGVVVRDEPVVPDRLAYRGGKP